MALPAEKRRYTFADCLAWDESDRAEVINGEIVMRNRKLTKIDVDGLYGEVRAYMEHAWRKEPTRYQLDMREVREYYHKWVEGKVQTSDDVFYQVNAR